MPQSSIFSFPVNLIAALLLISASFCWRKFFSRRLLQLIAIIALFVFCLLAGLLRNPQSLTRSILLSITGVYFLLVLGAVMFNNIRNYLSLCYFGFYLAFAAAFFSRSDKQEQYLYVFRNQDSQFLAPDSGLLPDVSGSLPDVGSARLLDFEISLFADGAPRSFEAIVELNHKQHQVRVNHPFREGKWKYYLQSYDTESPNPDFVCLLCVKQPGEVLIYIGILIMMAASVVTLLVGKRKEGRQ